MRTHVCASIGALTVHLVAGLFASLLAGSFGSAQQFGTSASMRLGARARVCVCVCVCVCVIFCLSQLYIYIYPGVHPFLF